MAWRRSSPAALGCAVLLVLCGQQLAMRRSRSSDDLLGEVAREVADVSSQLEQIKAAQALDQARGGDGSSVPVEPLLMSTTLAPGLSSPIGLFVLTFSRFRSLERLLKSLALASYTPDRPSLTIIIDFPKANASKQTRADWQTTTEMAEAWRWPHGVKHVVRHAENHGLARAWMTAWMPKSDLEAAVIFEDDLEVSPVFYRWLKLARATYMGMPGLAGFTLQRQNLVNGPRQKLSGIPSGLGKPYLSQLPGSWGFAPTAAVWRAFVTWYNEVASKPGFIPSVPGLVTTQWFESFLQSNRGDSMWTQWYIYYANMHHLFTMYANLPGGMALTMHWREPGEHFSEADAAAYRAAPEKLATTWSQVPAMPNPVPRYDWSMIAMEPVKAPVR